MNFSSLLLFLPALMSLFGGSMNITVQTTPKGAGDAVYTLTWDQTTGKFTLIIPV